MSPTSVSPSPSPPYSFSSPPSLAPPSSSSSSSPQPHHQPPSPPPPPHSSLHIRPLYSYSHSAAVQPVSILRRPRPLAAVAGAPLSSSSSLLPSSSASSTFSLVLPCPSSSTPHSSCTTVKHTPQAHDQDQDQRKPQQQTKRRVRFDLESSVVVSFVPLSPLSSSSSFSSSYRSSSHSHSHSDTDSDSDSDSDSSSCSSDDDNDDDYGGGGNIRRLRNSIDLDLDPYPTHYRRRPASIDGHVSLVLAGQYRGARKYSHIAKATAHRSLEHSSEHGLYAYRTKQRGVDAEEDEEEEEDERKRRTKQNKVKKRMKEGELRYNDSGSRNGDVNGRKRDVDEFHDEYDDDDDNDGDLFHNGHARGHGGKADIQGRLSLDSSLPLLHKQSSGASSMTTTITRTKSNISSSSNNKNKNCSNTSIPVAALVPSHHHRLHHHHGQLHCPRDALRDTKLCTALFRSARCHRIVVHGTTTSVSSSSNNNNRLQRLSSTMFSILPVAALHQLEGFSSSSSSSTKMSIRLIRGRARATTAHDYGVCPSWPHCHGSDGAMLIALVARALDVPMRSALRFQGDAAVRAVVKAVRVRRELFLDGRPTGSGKKKEKEKVVGDSRDNSMNSNTTGVDDGKDDDILQQQEEEEEEEKEEKEEETDNNSARVGASKRSRATTATTTRSSSNSTSSSMTSIDSEVVGDATAGHGDGDMDRHNKKNEDGGRTKGLSRRAQLRGKVWRVQARAKNRIRQTVGATKE